MKGTICTKTTFIIGNTSSMGWRTAQHRTRDHSVPTRGVVHMAFKYMKIGKIDGMRGQIAHETTWHAPTPATQLYVLYHGPKKQGDSVRDKQLMRTKSEGGVLNPAER